MVIASSDRDTLPRCVLMIVDALSYDVVKSLCETNELPNVRQLIEEQGKLLPCCSIFPSITPAATCSIITGVYPRQHGIEGAYWFDRQNEEIAYFGDDVSLAYSKGLHEYIYDFGDRLNFERLQVPTLYQHLHDRGIASASINYMWFAGPHRHVRSTPIALRLLAGRLPESILGPKYMKLGSFVEALPADVPAQPKPSIFSRYGFTDAVTASCVLDMAKHDALPPLTVAYFPENDDRGHEVGLRAAADTVLHRFDKFLGKFVREIGGWEKLGEQLRIIIVGDHSQVEHGEDGPTKIALDELLEGFKQADVGKGWQQGDQLFVCPNMRAAALYPRDPADQQLRSKLIDRLKTNRFIDQIVHQLPDGRLRVETLDRGSLTFARAQGHDDDNVVTDDYGNRWQASGELETLGLQRAADGKLTTTDYPNPLERLEGAFVDGAQAIWMTAHTNAEFTANGASAHPGGSHGSLQRADSESALVLSRGVDSDWLPNPARPRIVDVTPLCLRLLSEQPLGRETRPA